MTCRMVLSLSVLLVSLWMTSSARAEVPEKIEFSRDIRPILSTNCLECHGFDAESRQADLRLDIPEGAMRKDKQGHAAIVPGDTNASELIARISSQDDAFRMPPANANKKPLNPQQIDLLLRWIEQGAKWEQHWSFQRLEKPTLPDVDERDIDRVRTPIDAFVFARIRSNGLSPSSEADRRTLVRRVYFDLIGLAPTPEQLQQHLEDSRVDWYEQMVERLLGSAHYGERWARHWLDVAHYGDTHGYDKDKVRPNAWPYRDYVIRAFNEDKPYGRFVKEQIAGDVLWPDETDGVVGTGFIAAGPFDWVGQVEVANGTMETKQVRNLDRDDMVATTMNVFASMTVQCARCHDHKFDPISQKDYYSLQSIFAAVDRADRPYPVKGDSGRRSALIGKRDTLIAELKNLDAQMMERGGEELVKVDNELKQMSRATGQIPVRYGYHSQMPQRADDAKWVQIDLGQSGAIDEIQLIPAYDDYANIGAGFGFPVRFRIDVSDDHLFANGVTVVRDETERDFANPLMSTVTGKPARRVTARFVRVTATKLFLRQDLYNFALAEVRVLNAAGENIALGKKVTSLDTIEAPVRWGMVNLVDDVYYRVGEQAKPRMLELQTRRAALLKRVGISELDGEREIVETEVDAINAKLAGLPPQPMVYAAATEFNNAGNFVSTNGIPREIFLLKRGSEKAPDTDLGPMQPSAIGALAHLGHHFDLPSGHGEGDRRVALTNWLTDPNNPLTWRSIVNRVWHHHFGRGIVDTPNDFGQMGGVPTHPQLLDWLATDFRDNGQSLKELHRLIVNSSTYRQVSTGGSFKESIDAGNLLLWRMNRRKLEAEAIRDVTLQAAGKLDTRMGGPGFFVFGFKDDHSPHYEYQEYNPDDPATHRRAVYRFIVRSVPDPFMSTLDCADPSLVVSKRTDTLTALQSLALMNNVFMVRMGEHFAERVVAEREGLGEQIDRAFLLAISRKPTQDERAMMVDMASEHGLANACRLILNLNEFAFVD